MKTIVITGPSGSGKSYLTDKLAKLFYNSIIIKTDSYYRDNILIRLLSIVLYDIYDRPFSLKNDELCNTVRSIYKKDKSISLFKYDFKRKYSSKSKRFINYEENNQFLILEGIFAHRLNLNYKETINIVCEDEKELCFRRRLKRDQLERARDRREVFKKFNKSWYLFYKNINNKKKVPNLITLNTSDELSYNKLLNNLQKILSNKKTKKNI